MQAGVQGLPAAEKYHISCCQMHSEDELLESTPLDEWRVTPAAQTTVCSQITWLGLASAKLLLLSQRKH